MKIVDRPPADVVLLTPTRDRPLAFSFCERWMARQTYPGIVLWCVVDDGDEPARLTMGQLHIRRTPSEQHGTLPENVIAAESVMRSVPGGVIIIEDDDWYHPGYIAETVKRLGSSDVVGTTRSRYYRLPTRRFHEHANIEHSSFCSTSVARDGVNVMLKCAKESTGGKSQLIDLPIWAIARKRMKNDLWDGNSYVCGIKGYPGRTNLCPSSMLGGSFPFDADGSVLAKWTDQESAKAMLDKFPINAAPLAGGGGGGGARALVIAAWGGPRRVPDPAYDVDRGRYLRTWADSLRRFPNKIDVVIVSASMTTDPVPSFESGLEEISKAHHRVIIRRRPNIGLSYGAWSDVVSSRTEIDGIVGKQVDFWYLFEDDYVPCLPAWDDLMEKMRAQEPCCFLGSAVREARRIKNNFTASHVAVGWGVTDRASIEKTFAKRGRFSHASTDEINACEQEGNVQMYDWLMKDTGLPLRDVRNIYRSAYVVPSGAIIWHFAKNQRAIVVPAQFIPNNELTDKAIRKVEGTGVMHTRLNL